MDVTFFGVRGSIASPGSDTARVGGNTSTVEVCFDDRRIVLDAGTGLRALGQRMLARGQSRKLTLLLSHYHWDHIQGLPFFTPLYMPGTEVEIVGQRVGLHGVREALEHQMTAPVFPVRFADLPATLVPREVRPRDVFHVGDATVRVARGNHPGRDSIVSTHLSLLVDLAALLGREVDLDAILRSACERVAHALRAERATVWLVDADRGDLVSRVALDADLSTVRLPLGRGIAGWVAETGQAARVSSAREDTRFSSEADEKTGFTTGSVLAVPIQEEAGAPVRGVLQLLNRRD